MSDAHFPARSRLPARVLVIVAVTTTLGVVPGFLLGTLSLEIGGDFLLGPARVGFLIMGYLGVAAMLSAPGGRLVERVGAATGIRLAMGVTALGAVVMAVAPTLTTFAAGLLVCGVGHAWVYPATNLAIVRRVDPRRQGLTFGVKQASVPAATLIGGLAVPLTAAFLSWRMVFATLALGLVLVAALGPRMVDAPEPGRRNRLAPRLRMRPLLILAAGAGLAVGAIQPVAIFGVPYAAEVGIPPATAGTLLACASVFGVLMRVGAGWAADRSHGRDLFPVIGVYIVGGCGGVALLALAQALPAFSIAVMLAVTLGWSWNGLFHFAVVRANPSAPAAASSVTQAGLLTGTALGPSLFGVVAETISFRAAWAGSLASMLLGGLLLQWGGRAMRAGPMVLKPPIDRRG